MKIQILHINGTVLFETDAESLGAAVVAAVAAKAYLAGANLAGANLAGANLAGANLAGANLYGANLAGANLDGANLAGANLAGANLDGANLAGAYLAGANLYGAYLAGANLAGANLAGAYLAGANLAGAYLAGAYLEKLLPTRTIVADGDLIVWKKLRGGAICKLKIPAAAKRIGGLIGRKCRAEYAEVIEGDGVAMHDGETRYKPGEIVRPDKWDPNPLVECSNGIHFYITREEAEAHT